MGRDITIRIAGKGYRIPVESPDQEEVLREAAKIVNGQMDRQLRMNVTDRSSEDLLAMAALTISSGYVMQKREIERRKEEETQLHREIEGYLENIVKYSR